jgi:hypothetical protein
VEKRWEFTQDAVEPASPSHIASPPRGGDTRSVARGWAS